MAPKRTTKKKVVEVVPDDTESMVSSVAPTEVPTRMLHPRSVVLGR